MIKKHISKIIISIFLAFLILPSLLYPIVSVYIDTKITENRKLAEKPPLNIGNLLQYPQEFEKYFNDNLPFKNQFVKLNSYINFFIFHDIYSDRVLLGKDDWLFYRDVNDGDPLACYQRTNLLTDKELLSYKEQLVNVRDRLKANGKDFVLMIPPNKEQIYAEFMPSNISVLGEISRADQLVEYINNNTDIKVVYPKQELLNYRSSYELYFKYDTHWNEIGSFIGAQQLMKLITAHRDNIESYKIDVGEKIDGDLATMLNIQNLLPEDRELKIKNYLNEIEPQKKVIENIITYQSNSSLNKKILVLGDSFSTALEPYIAKLFKESCFISYKRLNPKELKGIDEDIFVLEVTERYLSGIPNQCQNILQSMNK